MANAEAPSSCEMDRTGDAKRRIRTAVAAARDSLTEEDRARYGRAVLARVMAMDAFRQAAVVMGYSSFGSELDTLPLLEQVLAQDKRLVLSKIERQSNTLRLYAVEDLDRQLVAGMWGIREPDPALCPEVDPGILDFVLMPGVAFDPRGGRIGYGKGYYDRLLARCIANGRCPWLVAGAFELQLVEHVPTEPHDIAVDAVVTESNYVAVRRDASLVPAV